MCRPPAVRMRRFCAFLFAAAAVQMVPVMVGIAGFIIFTSARDGVAFALSSIAMHWFLYIFLQHHGLLLLEQPHFMRRGRSAFQAWLGAAHRR